MNQRRQDDIARTLILCGSIPLGILVLLTLLDGFVWAVTALIGVIS